MFRSLPRPLPDRLHLGSAHLVFPGWLNTDVSHQLTVARVPGLAGLLHRLGRLSPELYRLHQQGVFRQIHHLDVTRRFPVPDASFAAVYSSHMLEHLYPAEARFCLGEVWRVMRPGGLLRLALPDLDRLVAEYRPTQPERFLDYMFQGRARGDHPRARHWWHYNAHSLGALLAEVGFGQIRRCTFQQGADPAVAGLDNRPESLVMEARR